MKYLQLFEQFLNEIETGEVLLGDHPGNMGIGGPSSATWAKFKLKYEVNTDDENEFLKWFRMWTNRQVKTPQLGEMLNDLLPLKKKFPNILDPTAHTIKSRKYHSPDKVYRVTAAPIRDIIKLSNWKEVELGHDPHALVADNTSYVHKVKNKVKVTSFSTSFNTVDDFITQIDIDMESSPEEWVKYLSAGNLNSKGAVMTVIMELPIDHPRLIMNPEASNVLSMFGEYEVFYIGTSIKPTRIFIPTWDRVKTAASHDEWQQINKYF